MANGEITPIGPKQALRHCLLAFGAGTGGMRIRRNAFEIEFWKWFLPSFQAALPDSSATWNVDKDFMLGLSFLIGQLAARNAMNRASYIIEAGDVAVARTQAVQANPVTEGGIWCTDPGDSGPDN